MRRRSSARSAVRRIAAHFESCADFPCEPVPQDCRPDWSRPSTSGRFSYRESALERGPGRRPTASSRPTKRLHEVPRFEAVHPRTSRRRPSTPSLSMFFQLRRAPRPRTARPLFADLDALCSIASCEEDPVALCRGGRATRSRLPPIVMPSRPTYAQGSALGRSWIQHPERRDHGPKPSPQAPPAVPYECPMLSGDDLAVTSPRLRRVVTRVRRSGSAGRFFNQLVVDAARGRMPATIRKEQSQLVATDLSVPSSSSETRSSEWTDGLAIDLDWHARRRRDPRQPPGPARDGDPSRGAAAFSSHSRDRVLFQQ